jgi:hypothetical protein
MFFEYSKTIANDFLQSIVFIDDKAFNQSSSQESPEAIRHGFDALSVTRAFATSEKICAVYKPESPFDIEKLIKLTKKADVSVLDWQIVFTKEDSQIDSEEDAEADDPRGEHTMKIIHGILSDSISHNSLKLIVIYTGETDLYSITNQIHDSLEKLSIQELKKGTCEVYILASGKNCA